jgi:hypothetical protein
MGEGAHEAAAVDRVKRVDLQGEHYGGKGVDIMGTENGGILGSVRLWEGEGEDCGEGCETVGSVVDRKVCTNKGGGEVGDKGVELEGSLDSRGVMMPRGVVAQLIVEDVAGHAVRHVDVAIPGAS